MIKKKVAKEIDRIVREIWSKNIPKDFAKGFIINEDCLKMSLCYHLRRKLSSILNENNLRIYTEKYLPGRKKRPDIIIAEIRNDYFENGLYSSIREEDVVALFELKVTSGMAKSTEDWIKTDLQKLKEYVHKSNLQCPLYFAIIYEEECEYLHWFDGRSTGNWAAGRVTELDAGKINGKMQYEIHPY